MYIHETHKRIYDIDGRDFKRALQLIRIDNFIFTISVIRGIS